MLKICQNDFYKISKSIWKDGYTLDSQDKPYITFFLNQWKFYLKISKNYLNIMKKMKPDLNYALDELENYILLIKSSDYWNIINFMKNLSKKYLKNI